MSARRILICGCCAVAALSQVACGRTGRPTAISANNNGAYVVAGPITYQLQVSRELNPYDTEDRGYLAGAKAATLGTSDLWYAVFLWAKNQTHHPAMTASSFDILDTQGKRYYPVHINPHLNPYAWQPQTLAPSAQLPSLSTTAFFGATQGEELLFKLNVSVYSNRPLTLEIHAPGEPNPSTISLDL